MKLARIPMDLRISFIYMLFGGLWILFSDKLLGSLITDVRLLVQIAIYKGWFFVGITGSVLYFMLKRDLALHRLHEEKTRKARNGTATSLIAIPTRCGFMILSPCSS
jgi:hypothetical protein